MHFLELPTKVDMLESCSMGNVGSALKSGAAAVVDGVAAGGATRATRASQTRSSRAPPSSSSPRPRPRPRPPTRRPRRPPLLLIKTRITFRIVWVRVVVHAPHQVHGAPALSTMRLSNPGAAADEDPDSALSGQPAPPEQALSGSLARRPA